MDNDLPITTASATTPVAKEVLAEGQWVSGVISRMTPIGYVVNLADMKQGLLFKDEVFQQLDRGQKVKVFVKKIREDGKIDLSLNKGGYKNFIDNSKETIMSELKLGGGFLPFTDKSEPEAIYTAFQISKKKFKEAIGALYKEQQIEITDAGIQVAGYKGTPTYI